MLDHTAFVLCSISDQIAVLENGKVAELGSYEHLMAKEDGAFKTLVRLQTFQGPA